MDKTKTIIYVVLIMGSLCCGFLVSYGINTTTPENPSIHNYFNKIYNMPPTRTEGIQTANFWQTGGDCNDRAVIFKEYLESMGAEDVNLGAVFRYENGQLVKISNGDSGHCFVVWNGNVFDPALNYYNIPLNKYLPIIKNDYGYNTYYTTIN